LILRIIIHYHHDEIKIAIFYNIIKLGYEN